MTLRLATVLSAREWEARLVAAARATASVRLTLRAFRPDEISDRRDDLDVVVVGSETPWASGARLVSWRRSGLRVVGVHPAGDGPGQRQLLASDLDLVLPDDLPAEVMLREIRLLDPPAARESAEHPLVAVTGPRGAPGRTEVALALAWVLADEGRTVLVDADLEAPAVAVRLGCPPRPDLADAVESVHESGTVRDADLVDLGRLSVIPGSYRRGEPPLRRDPVHDAIEALRASMPVVADLGPWPAGVQTIKASTTAIVVVDASPLGVVRAASLVADWSGPPPTIVLNRVTASRSDDAARALRRWTGLEASVVLPLTSAVVDAQRAGAPPHRRFLKAMVGVGR